MFERFCERGRGEKLRFYKEFWRFGFFPNLGGVTCSQNKRDTALFKSRNRSAEGRNIIYDFAGNCKDFLKVGYRLALKAGYSLALKAGYSLALEAGYSLALKAGYSLALEAGYSLALEAGYSLALEAGYGLALEAGYGLAGEARDDRERFKARISEAARTRDLLVRLARQTIGRASQSNSFSYIAGGPDLSAADCRPSGRGSRGGQYP